MGSNTPLSSVTDDEEFAATSGQQPGPGVLGRHGPALAQLQQFSAKAALLLWLWFDQQCEVMAEQVSSPRGQSLY